MVDFQRQRHLKTSVNDCREKISTLLLRWPDIICFRKGRLFSIQIFDHSAAFDCRDFLDAEKGMLVVNIKSVLLLRSIRIYEHFQQFSRTWFSKKMRIIEEVFPSYCSEQVLETQRF